MDYRVASNIRGKSFSDLMSDKISGGGGIGSSLRGAISDKIKAKATGIKEKFDPMNIARAVTGGSRLGPAILGRLTGRSRSDIDYFAGNKNKRSSYTQVPNSMSTPGEGLGGSAINVLSKMLAFMMKSRGQDIKKKNTAKQFLEEQRVEDQRRHSEFLDILKQYTLLDGGTTTIMKGGNESGLFDKFAKMLDDINVFKNPKALASLIGLLTNPLTLVIGGILAAAYGLSKLAEYLPNAKVLTPDEAQAALQSGSERDIDKLGGYDFLSKRITEGPKEAQKALDDYKEGRININQLNKLGGEEKLKKIASQKGLVVPARNVEQLPKKIAPRPTGPGVGVPLQQRQWDEKYGKDYNAETGFRKDLMGPHPSVGPVVAPTTTPTTGNTGTTSSIIPKNAISGSPMASMASTPSTQATPVPSTPSAQATPVPSAPISVRINDAISENQALSIESDGNTQSSSSPIISTINTVSNQKERRNSTTATVRDTTLILDHVLQMSVVPV